MMHRIYHNIMARPAPFEVRIYVLTLSGLCMSWRTIEISPLTMTKHNKSGHKAAPMLTRTAGFQTPSHCTKDSSDPTF